jgi:beta-glucosidase
LSDSRQTDARRLTRRHFLQGAGGTAVLAASSAKAESAAVANDAELDALLARMTLVEKLGQLTQLNGRSTPTNPRGATDSEQEIRQGRVGSFLGVSGAAATRRLQEIAVKESRLGIPLLFADDVIHGYRTVFPVPLAEAASFDPDAVERAARVAAIEATAHGLHWTFAPMLDIARDPRWGRVVEGSGEDPYLGAIMAAARVRGFQGSGPAESDALLATAKHFVAYGAAEGGRDYNTADISLRTLHETYLPPFRAAIDAGVQSVMVAFNELAGVPMHANRALVRDFLRARWGFDGIIISDYDGVRELIRHGVARDGADAGAQALAAGIDIEMSSDTYVNDLPHAVTDGRSDKALIDEAVLRVLRAKQQLGLFSDPYRYCDEARQALHTLTTEHRQSAREMARRSFVLLENRANALPLSRTLRTLAVIGPHADDAREMLGSWSGAGETRDVVTPLAGIRQAVAPATRVLYAQGVSLQSDEAAEFDEAERIARSADVVLLFIGESCEMTGEARSRSSLDLPSAQEALARRLVATGKPVVVVLFTGRPLSINWLAANASAILLAWYPGIEAGHALAETLFGSASPAGRLPVTFPRHVGQVPLYYAHKNTGRPFDPNDNNTSKYLDVLPTPLYPFGYGLSYTKFRYENPRLSAARIRPSDTLVVRVDVVNEGARDGEEVVQLYLRDDVASITPPVRELRGFRRISLRAGERREVVFELGPRDFSFCGRDLNETIEPGTFTVFVGGDSEATLEVHFEIR